VSWDFSEEGCPMQRMVAERDSAFVDIEYVTYQDNPFLSEAVESEIAHCKRYRPKDHSAVWLGKKCNSLIGMLNGIFGKMRKLLETAF
jgi:hypothetical protein